MEGILIVNNDGVPLKSTLSAEQTTQYASLFSQLSSKARSVVRTLDATVRRAHAGLHMCSTLTLVVCRMT